MTTRSTLKLIAVALCLAFGLRLFPIEGAEVTASSSLPCALRQYPTGLVCVCNVTYCDTLEFDVPILPGDFLMFSTSEAGERFKQFRGSFGQVVNASRQQGVTIELDRSKKFQKVVGFGGSFTGAVSYNLDKLRPDLRHSLYRSLYSKKVGNGYNVMRIPIGASDFDLRPWAYNELPVNDTKLSNFTKLDPRDMAKVEQIKELEQVADIHDIKFLGAAWSPPKWMKTNNDWSGFGQLKTEYYQTWADYHIRYLKLMNEAGMTYWAISTGNEPTSGLISSVLVAFLCLGWMPSRQGQWVAENLGPALKASNFSNIKLFASDDQRYTFPWWFMQMDRGNPKAMAYVDGLAYHWYWNQLFPATLLDLATQMYPGKLILSTEASSGLPPFDIRGPMFGSWIRAESYITDIIQNLNNGVQGWIDWNLLLDDMGGPNYVQNYLDSTILVNRTTGEEAYKQPIFYALGHFSRFIIENSVGFDTKSSDPDLLVVGFERPDYRTTLVFYNRKSIPSDVTIKDPQRGVIQLQLPPRSLHSIVYI